MNKKKVLVGMSGGVDSSVAAAILLEKGYDVIGATLQIWPKANDDKQNRKEACCSLSAVDDARKVADNLGIPYYVFNLEDIFKEKVIDYFIREYLRGRTPNPCIACNRHIKFEALLNKAVSMGIDYIATGHYARIEYDNAKKRYLLKKSISEKKDQTYVLYNLTQWQLSRTLLPIGSYTKEQVRDIAENLGMATVAAKPESQEICFVEDNDYGRFICENTGENIAPGNFIDMDGNILGRHKGIIHYTIGQRKGLGIALGKPLYVVDIDAENNTVILGDENKVFSDTLIAGDLNFIAVDRVESELRVTAKIRYTAKEAPAVIIPQKNNKLKVVFATPQRAITLGQSVVFYKGDIVVGGGVIESRIDS
jgi:tRNA-specific 2-thiouridylase